MTFADEEVEGLDECAVGAPEPHTASDSAADYAMPTVMPQRVRPLAVIALVLAVVVPFVAVPLGHVVLRRHSIDGRPGRRLAQAAIIVGYLMTLLLALIGLNLAVAVLFRTP